MKSVSSLNLIRPSLNCSEQLIKHLKILTFLAALFSGSPIQPPIDIRLCSVSQFIGLCIYLFLLLLLFLWILFSRIFPLLRLHKERSRQTKWNTRNPSRQKKMKTQQKDFGLILNQLFLNSYNSCPTLYQKQCLWGIFGQIWQSGALRGNSFQGVIHTRIGNRQKWIVSQGIYIMRNLLL